jgi:hypothetical protein
MNLNIYSAANGLTIADEMYIKRQRRRMQEVYPDASLLCLSASCEREFLLPFQREVGMCNDLTRLPVGRFAERTTKSNDSNIVFCRAIRKPVS